MGKKIKIYESEIKRATRRKLMENYLDEDYEMRDTYSKRDFKPTPREKGIEKVFGKYGDDMDPAVIRYMRKNPDAILRRMAKQYPDIYMRHAPVQPDYRDYPGPINVSNQYDEEGYYIDESEQMDVYDNASELSNDLSSGKIASDTTVGVKIGDDIRTARFGESTKDLFKRFLKESNKDIDCEKLLKDIEDTIKNQRDKLSNKTLPIDPNGGIGRAIESFINSLEVEKSKIQKKCNDKK